MLQKLCKDESMRHLAKNGSGPSISISNNKDLLLTRIYV